MHQHLSGTVIPFDFAVYTYGSIAFQTKQFKFNGRVYQTVTNNFGFLSQLSSLMFMNEPVIMMRLVA
jgi:hypothetical protein